MKPWRVVAVSLAAMIAFGGALAAQEDSDEDYYLDEEIPDQVGPKYGLGFGIGLIELGDNVIAGQQLIADDDVEQYYLINFRIRFGDRHAYGGPSSGGFRGYLEPELGYWSSDQSATFAGGDQVTAASSDLLLGINIIGAMPVNAVEFFLGGGIGIHFIDADVDVRAPRDGQVFNTDDSDEALGINAQFGVDVAVSKKVSVFAVGRFDIVDDSLDELEGKAYVGLRVLWGHE